MSHCRMMWLCWGRGLRPSTRNIRSLMPELRWVPPPSHFHLGSWPAACQWCFSIGPVGAPSWHVRSCHHFSMLPLLFSMNLPPYPLLSSPISSMWTSLERTTRDKQSGPLAHLQRSLHKSGWVCVCVRVPSLACYVLLPFSLKSPARTTQWRVFTWTCCSLYVMRDVTKGLSLCAVVWSSFPQWSIRILSYALGCYFIQFPLLLSYQQYVDLTKDTMQAGTPGRAP